ncbi:MAG TPA: alginate lyase family protein [Chitinophagaceae bacterium]|nr:alginate lyase family protein [Chitinophagaceae bacterium]
MIKKLIPALLLCVTVLMPVWGTTQKGKPLVFVLNREALANNKSRVAAKDPAIMGAYKQLIKEADKALQFGPVSVMEKKSLPPSGDRHDYMSLAPYHWPDPAKPDGLPYIRKDGQTNPEVKEYKDKEYLPQLCSEVHTLALAYFFSSEKVYAEHAAKLVRVWFLDTATRMNPNLNFGQAVKGVNTGRGAGMIDTRHFVKLIDALGLLNEAPEWKEKDQLGMKKWFTDFLQWMQTSVIGRDEMDAENNHGAWYDAQRLAMALYTGDMPLADRVVKNAAARLDQQMNEEGFFPKELARTISLHYSTFVLHAFFAIANMAEHTGTDLWKLTTPSGKSLQKAFNVIRPFLSKEKDWEGQQIKPFTFEDGYGILYDGAAHFQCKNCKEEVKRLAADKAERLLLHLLY